MFKLNRKLEYALISLKHINHKQAGELSTAKEISKLYKTPFDATSRVLQLMAGGGILKSEQGAHGGYQILKDLTKVSFLDLAELIVGRVGMVDCLYEDDCACELHDSCNILSPIHWLNERTKEFYKSLTVFDLIETRVEKKTTAADLASAFVV